jgi:Pentapeptide repeats (9 copies)
MGTIQIDKGMLKGLALESCTSEQLQSMADPAHTAEIIRFTFYKGEVGRAVYRGVLFFECGFAKSVFHHVSFYKCRFHRVDLVRTRFKNCFFFKCEFEDCDPYYAQFEDTEIDPASFAKCYRRNSDWNKALVLFSGLRRSLEAYGEGRLSRAADYYFRTWQRRRLQYLWKSKQRSGFVPWFWNVCIWLLTGYGERPAYLSLWAAGIISLLAVIYEEFFPYAVADPKHGYADFWYLSFRVFFGSGFATNLQTLCLFAVQLGEFACGLSLVALLIASITRKLSP